jgi:hypothetical protein
MALIANLHTHIPSRSFRALSPASQSVVSFARAENVLAYAANDAIGDAETNTTLTFEQMTRHPGGSCKVKSAHVTMSGAPTAATLHLLLFKTVPVGDVADNASYTMVDAEKSNLLGIMTIIGTDSTLIAGWRHWSPSWVPDSHAFVLAPTDTSVYGLLLAGAALTPVSGGSVLVKLEVEQD